ncbi:hypothetical protein D3C77_339980 [compost metagenome]
MKLLCSSGSDPSPSHKAEYDQIPRFMLVDVTKLVNVGQPLLPFHIGNLSANHAGRPGKARQILYNGQSGFSGNPMMFTGLNDTVKSMGQQRVTRQYGHGLPKHLMIRRLAATKIIIIHGRKVIMNQGIRMYHLNGAGDGQRRLAAALKRLCGGNN